MHITSYVDQCTIYIYIYIYKKKNDIKYRQIFLKTLFILTFATLITNIYFVNKTGVDSAPDQAEGFGVSEKRINEDVAASLLKYKVSVQDDSFFRYDTDYDEDYGWDINNGMLYGLSTPWLYFTLSNNYVNEFRRMFYDSHMFIHMQEGYENRIVPTALSSIKYYSVFKDKKHVPEEYKKVYENDIHAIYRTKTHLPISYAYDKFIPKEEFERFNIGEKGEAILKNCIASKKIKTNVKRNRDLNFEESTVCYRENDITINATKDDNTYIIRYEMEDDTDCEYTIVFQDCSYEGDYENVYISISDALGVASYVRIRDPINRSKNFSVRLNANKVDGVLLCFDQPGEYKFRKIYIVKSPKEYIFNNINNLKLTGLKNAKVENNRIIGDIDLDKDKLLVFSIPYSKFWKAYIDGKRVETFVANIKNIGISIDKGNHKVELLYDNTLCKYGTIISLVTFIIMLLEYFQVRFIKDLSHNLIEFAKKWF